MKTPGIHSKATLFLIILCHFTLFVSAPATAWEASVYDIDLTKDTHFLAKRTKITNVTMWTEDGLSGVVAFGEKWVVVSSYRFKSVVCRPTLVDIDGHPITLSALRKGQWIRVQGFNHNGRIICEKIVLQGRANETHRPGLEPLQSIQ